MQKDFGSRRRVLSVRWWHKWIGIGIGAVLAAWVVSGVIMLLPQSPRSGGAATPAADLSRVTVTPAQAAAAAMAQLPGERQADGIRRVSLEMLRDTVVYVVLPMKGQPVLVNAATGVPFVVSESFAREIAQANHPDATLGRIDRLTTAQRGYSGRLPAYRVEFDDGKGTIAYVAEANGELQSSQRRDRLMTTIGHDVHVFAGLGEPRGNRRIRMLALFGTAFIALLTVTSGYWLAIPRRLWRSATARASTDPEPKS